MNNEIFKWNFGVGDPSILGWLVCLLYLLTSALCLKKYLISKTNKAKNGKIWALITLILFFLSVNKQMDFQTLISDVGRAIAVNLELMEYRHIIKRAFILVLGLSGLSIILSFRQHIYDFFENHKLAFVGMTSIFCFVFLRASSFHIFNDSTNSKLNSFYFFESLELASITTLLIAVLLLNINKERLRTN